MGSFLKRSLLKFGPLAARWKACLLQCMPHSLLQGHLALSDVTKAAVLHPAPSHTSQLTLASHSHLLASVFSSLEWDSNTNVTNLAGLL